MPAFVQDTLSTIDSQSSGVVHLDSPARFGLDEGKLSLNGPNARQPHSHTSHESFGESSTNSTKSTNTSRTSVELERRPTDDCLHLPSMIPQPNGCVQGGEDEVVNGARVNGASSQLLGKSMHTLVDRTIPRLATKGKENGLSMEHERHDLSSDSKPDQPQQPETKADSRPVENETAPAETPSTSRLEAPSSAQVQNLQKTSPHRYSSPPIYEPGPSSTSTLQSAPTPGIRQRHTLEVPKVSQSRSSRDSADAAYASGRFSPTIPPAPRRASLSLGRRNTRSLHSEGPRDEIIPDEDAMRWAEALRQKRASKRRRRELEDDDRVLVGTKVDESHANWVTAYNMLTGIRVAVSRTNAKVDRPLTDEDFEVKQKSTFDIAGNELVPSAKYDFKFKDYAPWVFRHLRALFRLDPADYLMSLTGKYILSELGSPGKSGSFFYFSRDYKYIIKTIHHAEHKFLRKILRDYYQHVKENPNTLLSQFYGLHRVKMPYGKKIHFVVMNNLFPPHRDIHQTFDLKGSTVGREYKEEDLENNPRATLKDINWMRRKRTLELGIQKKKLFLEQLHKDVRLLQRLQIMDYSLLIGIHDLQRGNEENLRDKTLRVFNPGGNSAEDNDPNAVLMRTPSKLENQRKARELRQMIQSEKPVPMNETDSRMPDELDEGHSRPGFIFNQDDGGFRATHEDNSPADEIYYLGVIDCLTHYGIVKKLEHFWKGLSSDRSQISALPPYEYGERFINFIEKVTMSREEAARLAQQQEEQQAAEAAAKERQRTASWGSLGRKSSSNIPPAPSYHPPPPPPPPPPASGQTDATPDRTARTVSSTPTITVSGREPTILPVVEEAAEGPSTGNPSQQGDSRPSTSAKDGDDRPRGFGFSLSRLRSKSRPPPTPPKNDASNGLLAKPESADSGYAEGNNGSGSEGPARSEKSLKMHDYSGNDGLGKALPPLPHQDTPARMQNVS